MPYALLSVQRPDRQSDVPTAWLNVENGAGLPKDAEKLPGNLLLLPLPSSLPFLGRIIEELEKCTISYALAFFDEKPEFAITKSST